MSTGRQRTFRIGAIATALLLVCATAHAVLTVEIDGVTGTHVPTVSLKLADGTVVKPEKTEDNGRKIIFGTVPAGAAVLTVDGKKHKVAVTGKDQVAKVQVGKASAWNRELFKVKDTPIKTKHVAIGAAGTAGAVAVVSAAGGDSSSGTSSSGDSGTGSGTAGGDSTTPVTSTPTGSPFAGSYSGNYQSICYAGTVTITIDANGNITGTATGGAAGSVSGSVNSNGQLSMSGGGGDYAMTMTAEGGTGTFTCHNGSHTGTFTLTRN